MATRSTKKQKETDETIERALAVPLSAAELQTRIRARANEIFLARNGAPGDELSDWLTAEREVCGSLLTSAPLPDEVVPIPATAPKRKRATTAKPAVASSSTQSSKKALKSPAQPPSTAPRSRKRKTTDE